MTHKRKILTLLSDGKVHTCHELYALGCVAHSRVAELRRDGHDIDCWRDGDNYMYRLLRETEALPVPSPSSVSLSCPAPNPAADDGDAPAHRDGDGQLALLIPAGAYDRA